MKKKKTYKTATYQTPKKKKKKKEKKKRGRSFGSLSEWLFTF